MGGTERDTAPRKSTEEWNAAFETLASSRRRTILSLLSKARSSATIDDLATTIAATDRTLESAEGSPNRRQEVLVSLHHVHLPKLVEAGFLEWDRDSGSVRTTDGFPNPDVVGRLDRTLPSQIVGPEDE